MKSALIIADFSLGGQFCVMCSSVQAFLTRATVIQIPSCWERTEIPIDQYYVLCLAILDPSLYLNFSIYPFLNAENKLGISWLVLFKFDKNMPKEYIHG